MIISFRHKGPKAFYENGTARGIQSLKGHSSVWVSGNWRVTFRFAGNDVELVDYVDYH